MVANAPQLTSVADMKGPKIPNTIKAPRGFVPHRIKLQRRRKELEARMSAAYDRNEHLIPERNRDED